MSEVSWQPEWLRQHCGHLSMDGAWRGVETQYIAASMKLVDNLDEQEVLELLLEGSKPPAPAARHYLIASPFRYHPQHDSRFRPGTMSGLWYGSSTLEGACSEVAYWRMRFLLESAGLAREGELVTEHTFFQANVRGQAINLMDSPWVELAALWKHSSNYTETHKLAAAAREAGCVDWIQYESVRAPSCALAVALTPDAVHADVNELESSRQEWTCKTTKDGVMMISKDGKARFSWVD